MFRGRRTERQRVAERGAHQQDIYAQALHAMYFLLATIASRSRSDPTLDDSHIEPLEAAYGALPNRDEHDGLVPVVSQLWGDLVAAVTADHLDIVGHYGDPEQGTTDWLPAETGFDANAFRTVWSKIVDYQLAAVELLSAENAATRTG